MLSEDFLNLQFFSIICEYTEIAENACRAVFHHIRSDGFIPGQISIDANANYSYCCLTGNCQMAIISFKLYEATGDKVFLDWGPKGP